MSVTDKDALGVEKSTPKPAGVATQGATDQQPTSDEDMTVQIEKLAQDLDAAKTQFEGDLSKQKSAIQSASAVELRQAEAQHAEVVKTLESQLRTANLQYIGTLDDADQEQYLTQIQQEDQRKLETQRDVALARAQQAEQILPSVQAAAQLGVDVTKLDPQDPYGSMWSGFGEVVAGLKEEIASLKKDPQTPAEDQEDVAPTGEKPPVKPNQPVLTGQRSASGSGEPTLNDVRKALATELGREISIDEVFTLAEQRPDLEQKLAELTAAQDQ